jgi:hypothetical protein
MELDDFKTAWTEQDAVLVNARAMRSIVRTEHALRRHERSVIYELISNAVALLLIGSFLGDHLAEPRFLAPAIVLHLFVIGLTIACARQLVLLRNVDPAEPVVEMQKRVERVRIARIRMTQATLIAAPLLWTPLLIVVMKGLFGADAWDLFGTKWMMANLLFGALVVFAMLAIARRVRGGVMDDLAGRTLQTARQHLDDVAQFERE